MKTGNELNNTLDIHTGDANASIFKYASLMEYDGTRFNGTQIQIKGRTVQEELEKALKILLKQKTNVTFSGRTDAGVSALGQVVHFSTEQELDLYRFMHSLNAILPGDVAVREMQRVSSDFCARRSATRRWYRFTIYNHLYKTALQNKALHLPKRIDETLIDASLKHILGTHDFESFKSANSDSPSSVCTVYKANCTREGDYIYIDIVANRFLYNMIRILVGTVVKVALEGKPADTVHRVLQSRDRAKAGETVKPEGLTLMAIEYPDKFRLFEGDKNPKVKDILKENYTTEAVFHENIYRKAS